MEKTTFKQIALAAALVMGFAGHAGAQSQATNLNYNEISFDIASIKQKDNGGSSYLHGYGLSGRYLFAENWYAIGSETQVTSSYSGQTSKDQSKSIGLGGRYGLSKDTDLIAEIEYASDKLSSTGSPNTNTHENSYGFGIRSLVTPTVELSTFVASHDPSKDSKYTSVAVGMGYHLSKEWVLRGSYSTIKVNGTTQDAYVFSVGYKF